MGDLGIKPVVYVMENPVWERMVISESHELKHTTIISCYRSPCSESLSRTNSTRSSGGNTGTLTRSYPKEQ